LVVKAGATIPVDGRIVEGAASIDESAISGESVPVDRGVGDEVTGATINRSGWFTMEATHVGDDTALARIIALVDQATSSKAPIERIADRISGVFVPVVIGIALVTFIIWLLVGAPFEVALSHGITVLVISCPCALGLATPTAIMVGTGRGATNGILIKSAEILETACSASTVVFDKTGTITTGTPRVTDVCVSSQSDQNELLHMARAIEDLSDHPLARSIVSYVDGLTKDSSSAIQLSDFKQIPGYGIEAASDQGVIRAGNSRMMDEASIEMGSCASTADEYAAAGKTPLFFSIGDRLLGVIALLDTAKPNAAQAMSQLKHMGLRTVMLTGDDSRVAHAIAQSVGVDQVIAGVRPQDKEREIRQIQKDGSSVAMVGDGINDAPALVRADVGVAIGTGTDVAIDSADIVLVRSDLMDVPSMLQLSHATMRNIKQNLFWALFYNSICIPIAAGVFSFAGLTINPMIAAAAMGMSSVCVVSNALRLRTWKPKLGEGQAQWSGPTARNDDDKNITYNDSDKGRGSGSFDNEGQQTPSRTDTGVSTGISSSNSKEQKIDAKEIVMDKKIMVEGMMCQHCVAHVRSALEEIDGVESADVDLDNACATVHLSADVDDATLCAAIVDAGYKAKMA
jgi:Cu2+-exporting ATPase